MSRSSTAHSPHRGPTAALDTTGHAAGCGRGVVACSSSSKAIDGGERERSRECTCGNTTCAGKSHHQQEIIRRRSNAIGWRHGGAALALRATKEPRSLSRVVQCTLHAAARALHRRHPPPHPCAMEKAPTTPRLHSTARGVHGRIRSTTSTFRFIKSTLPRNTETEKRKTKFTKRLVANCALYQVHQERGLPEERETRG